MLAKSELCMELKRCDFRAAAIAAHEHDKAMIRVGQVRDVVGIESSAGHSAFAIVTQIVFGKLMTRITYDLVTDTEIIRNQTVGRSLFLSMFPTIYLNHIRESKWFCAEYRRL